MREVLFRRQDDYFDRFASPIHFFRSPHAQLILAQGADSTALEQPDYALDIETQMSLNHYASFNRKASEPIGLPELTRCRAYARTYPQSGTKVSMPVWNITTGSQSPLYDQAVELSKVLRRSIARHTLKSQSGRTRWHDPAEKQYYEDYAQERVQFNSCSDTGLWSQQKGDTKRQTHINNVGSWMKQCLSPDFS
jgi:hypothetical protein